MSGETENLTLKEVLTEILWKLCSVSDCQCSGIRLNKDGDYPYYVHAGFPEFFILKENSLCAKDQDGNPLADESGDPLLECMCGNVIKGRFDPKLPYFTRKGSFWTNSTTQLLSSTTDTERLTRTRNMCHYSGYESVALIPMRFGDKTLGLIQLNDPRENMFTLQDITTYEYLADHVGKVVVNALQIQDKVNDVFEMMQKVKRA
jgi:GAF domain-containing protein